MLSHADIAAVSDPALLGTDIIIDTCGESLMYLVFPSLLVESLMYLVIPGLLVYTTFVDPVFV